MRSRLHDGQPPDDEFFPNASRALAEMSEADFEYVGDTARHWAGMVQYFRLHWNPEERAVATVCLCEQGNVAYSFISITSRTEDGRVYHTTNFPFAPKLKNPPGHKWNHVPCERSCFWQILQDHHRYLKRVKVAVDTLALPDPDAWERDLEKEMQLQIDHNLEQGIIVPAEDGNFRYALRGLFFLWGQSVKDMIRVC